jgi:hypothetical protein
MMGVLMSVFYDATNLSIRIVFQRGDDVMNDTI